MERNTETKTLSFSKGVTNVPSDLLCEDSELLESDGFIFRDGEMKPIQKPVSIGNVSYKIMYVHKMADFENLIAVIEHTQSIAVFKRKDDGTYGPEYDASYSIGETYSITSIGNTLICATERGLSYLLYKNGKYKSLGTELPTPSVEFQLSMSNADNGGVVPCRLEEIVEQGKGDCFYSSDGNLTAVAIVEGFAEANYHFCKKALDATKQQDFYNAVQGHVSATIAKAKEKNRFVHPFFLRYALRLYDGTYARISTPIICYPCTNKNCYFVPVIWDEDQENYIETNKATTTFLFSPFSGVLHFTASISNLSDWKDIVKELVVFASDDVLPYELDGEGWDFVSPMDSNKQEYYNSPTGFNPSSNPLFPDIVTVDGTYYHWTTSHPAECVIMPKYKSDTQIIKELVSKSQFYKLFSVKVSNDYYFPSDSLTWREAPIDAHVVENLTSQEQLAKDDYYGWTKMIIKGSNTEETKNKMYAYNKRLNLFGIRRKPFKGFSVFADSATGSLAQYTFAFYVHISSDKMDAWVVSDGQDYNRGHYANGWFFYPDPNATEVIIWDRKTNQGMRLPLENHPMLNGAYSFNKLPTANTFVSDSSVSIPTVDEDAYETLDSQIFTSVVNNPFVFEASGDNTVGTGKIVGIVANTEAVSQGQFGQYPLMVFTTEGIYGMSVNSEGLYSATYPISREVCLENSPLVPTDRLVFFVSKKGLMAASGGSVACMSEQLRGRTPRNFATLGDGSFIDFLKDCLIAYDYRDSMLRIFSSGKDYQYIYNMADKTFSLVNSGMEAKAIVNDYPDNLIQDTYGNVYSLTEKPDINDDENFYSGTITTRPLKLGGSLILKSLRNIRNLRTTQTGTLSLEIWASNNAANWCKLHSLLGKPWAYFTFKYTLHNFKACDSFAGSIVKIQNRREINH